MGIKSLHTANLILKKLRLVHFRTEKETILTKILFVVYYYFY